MNNSYCVECGAAIPAGRSLCPGCLLSAGAATEPAQPAGLGISPLPCMFGGYKLLKRLGAGGMGIVYEAEDTLSGRRMALKVLSHGLDTEEQRKRFLREGRLAATIDHPNSVYVFGADEVQGLPVIAMELATGGTLRDLFKRRGPLPVREAVDLILGVIDGLESAHAKGILHRDMKPSNCFITGDGKAMVGDYGLSISQNHLPVDDEQLTRSGLIMGTPAFSPPEQLRGQPLDLRADIYSTSGTLYYLLTGKAPVELESAVETVAAVLEGRIIPVNDLRPDVPEDLAVAVMRGLSADATKRPASYAELRAALAPFNSIPAEPAPLRTRFLAGLLDDLLLTNAGALLMPHTEGPKLVSFMICVAYYGLLESYCGATPGKWLCDLRVSRLDNSRPGLLAALLRAGLYVGLPYGLIWLVWGVLSTSSDRYDVIRIILALLLPASGLILFVVPSLFRGEKAGWHDRLTGLRVRRRGGLVTERLRSKNVLPARPAPTEKLWGPFYPGTALTPRLRCGFDPILHRNVLMTLREWTSPSLARRECSRGGRLRWLQSVQNPEGGVWDAWQAPAGGPLSAVLSQKVPTWGQLLNWVDDLTTELDAADKDGTLPICLSVNHVWITVGGRALLLDDAWPGTIDDGYKTTDSQAFLHHLLQLAPSTHRPLHADPFLLGLKNGGFQRLSHVLGNVAHLKQQCSTVTRSKRFFSVVAPVVFILLPILIQAFIQQVFPHDDRYRAFFVESAPVQWSSISWPSRNEDSSDARGFISVSSSTTHGSKPPPSAGSIGVHVTHFGGEAGLRLSDDESNPMLQVHNQKIPADAVKLAAIAQSQIDGHNLYKEGMVVMSLVFMVLFALVQLVCIILAGAPLLMKLTGISPVSTKERPAGRGRMMWRWLIGWAPLGSQLVMLIYLEEFIGLEFPVMLLAWLPLSVIVMYTLLLVPGRSLLDRLAGTWLVAR